METGGKKKQWGEDNDREYINKYLGFKDGRSSKKFKR